MNKSDKTHQYQRALVLHTRPYRNNSLLVDFFCEHSGLLRCVALGQRSSKSKRDTLTQFCVYTVAFSGKSDLKTLVKLEAEAPRFLLEKQALFCALYVNELLLRVLFTYDPHPYLFQLSCEIYRDLSECENMLSMEEKLRVFEFALLKDIGYLVDMRHDYQSGKAIEPDTRYRFDAEQGFTHISPEQAQQALCVSGQTILAIAKSQFNLMHEHNEDHAKAFRKESKMLSRLMLAPYLGDKPLQSRALFEALK